MTLQNKEKVLWSLTVSVLFPSAEVYLKLSGNQTHHLTPLSHDVVLNIALRRVEVIFDFNQENPKPPLKSGYSEGPQIQRFSFSI